jgi:hypothetical protein
MYNPEDSSREYLQIQIFIFLLPYCHKFFGMPLFKGGIDGGRLVGDGNNLPPPFSILWE